MHKLVGIIYCTLVILTAGVPGLAYSFWGVSVGSEYYDGSEHLTFSGLGGTSVQYSVGGYKYTRVDSTWTGPYPAPAPGEGYMASRRSDAQGIFFLPDPNLARFVIITTSSQTGAAAPEVGCGPRLFGTGDLKIDVGDSTYGVGLRIDGLLWAIDPTTTNAEFQIYRAEGGIDSIRARDAGTLGQVELNPRWARAGHAALPAGSDAAYAFYVSGSGAAAGSAQVSWNDTGINLCGAQVYAYEVSVPWSTLGISGINHQFTASYRPDCGNDIIVGDFTTGEINTVPEPAGALAVSTGLIGIVGMIRRR